MTFTTTRYVPKNWQLCELQEISEIVTGKTPSKKKPENFGNDIPFVKPGDIYNQGIIEKTEESLSLAGANTVPNIPANSITVTCIGNLGRVAITKEVSATNQQINSVIPFATINFKFIYYYLMTIRIWMESEASSTTIKIINKGKFSKAPILLSPLKEQKRISDKLDSLLDKVNQNQKRLDKIPEIIKRFRQSVLSAATTGKLTKEWREANDFRLKISPKDIENDAFDVWNRTAVKDIPSSWNYLKFCELGSIQGGGTPRKSESEYWNGEIPWVTPKDMKVDYISNSKLKITDLGVIKSSAKYIEKNSLLFVVRGMILAHSFPVAKTLEQVTINQDMKALTPIDQVAPDYLLFALKSLAYVFVELASSSTHGTKRLEAKMYNNVAIPVPPVEEQKEIVRRLESLFALADSVEKQYLTAKKRLDKLTQSILAKAFRGELVPQDPNDEPASVLLEKIQQEKSSQTKPSRKKNSRKASKKTPVEKESQQEQVEFDLIQKAVKFAGIPDDYLYNTLLEMGGTLRPERLWNKSNLSIDDFYAQLKAEMASGFISENKSSLDPELRSLEINKKKNG